MTTPNCFYFKTQVTILSIFKLNTTHTHKSPLQLDTSILLQVSYFLK